MTIRKGSGYGRSLPLPKDAPIVVSDAELHSLIVESRSLNEDLGPVGVLGGDLCRTLGGTGDRNRLQGPEAQTFPVDLVLAKVNDIEVPVVSHLIAGRLFGSDFLAVMNAQWWGAYDLGPRAHPGDGLFDVTSGHLRFGQRRLARRRARTGTHLPHPALASTRTSALTVTFDRKTTVIVDDIFSDRTTSVELHLLPDAIQVVI